MAGLEGLSGIGPSHNSVRMLSSERRRESQRAFVLPGGVQIAMGAESGYCESASVDSLRGVSSSRSIGIFEIRF